MPPDAVLAFDTSGPWCAAALAAGDHVEVRVEEMATGQAEALMPVLEGLLAARRLLWRDLAAIGVGTGPGNFTGTRIAVAAARGLALGLGVPAVGVAAEPGEAPEAPEALVRRIAAEAARRRHDPDLPPPAPVYARPPDAAPRRDPPLVILPG